MGRIDSDFRRRHLVWDGPRLRLHNKREHVVATVDPDQDWKDMWRVRTPNGHLTDRVNWTRARDAAACLALDDLNVSASHREAPPMRSFARPLSVGLST